MTIMWIFLFLFLFCCDKRGYLSPEYASFGHISTAIDVYSFGIMVLEIISGRKNMDFEKPPEQQILLQWVWINFLVSYNMGYPQILYVTYICVYVCNHEDDSRNNFSLMESLFPNLWTQLLFFLSNGLWPGPCGFDLEIISFLQPFNFVGSLQCSYLSALFLLYFCEKSTFIYKVLLIHFWTLFLMISFEDVILVFYIWVLNTTIEVNITFFQYTQHFVTTFRHLTKKIMVLRYRSSFFSTLYHACTLIYSFSQLTTNFMWKQFHIVLYKKKALKMMRYKPCVFYFCEGNII